jgi:RNA polymerase subunit RPABC4/transcription elongation factor Spt4
MKHCHECEVMIPDHAHHCPHCRRRQRRGEWQLQAVLLLAAAAAAIAVLAETC